MNNKHLTFEKAVKSGKDFRCVETGAHFKNMEGGDVLFDHNFEIHFFQKQWLDQTFEIIEVKKELTASEIDEAFEYVWDNSHHADIMKERLLKKLGF